MIPQAGHSSAERLRKAITPSAQASSTGRIAWLKNIMPVANSLTQPGRSLAPAAAWTCFTVATTPTTVSAVIASRASAGAIR
jgi:uncharacterized protein with beta-barrel porin domain